MKIGNSSARISGILVAGLLAATAFCVLPAGAQPTRPALAKKIGPPVETVKIFADFRTLGIAVSREGRIFASAPSASTGISVLELDARTGVTKPYPDLAWNTPTAPADQPQWVSVQAMWVDRANHLWALDSSRARPGRAALPAKLVEFDLAANTVIRNYSFAGVVAPPDALNDLRVDLDHGYVYLTNAGNKGSLVVLNIATGQARQVLVADRSTFADPTQHLMFGAEAALRADGSFPATHADGIALSPDNVWLYYRPLTDHHYYRIRTADLRDTSLGADALSKKVEYLGQAEMTGGLIMDYQDTLYGGDLEHGTVVALTLDPAGKSFTSRVFVNDPGRLAWADGFAISGGYLYISDSHLNEMGYKNHLPVSGPFSIFRVKLPRMPRK